MTEQDSRLLDYIWLSMVFYQEPSTAQRLLGVYRSDTASLCRALRDGSCPVKKETLRRRIVEVSESAAQRMLDYCRESGIHLITLADSAYPDRLRVIADPPILLTGVGNMELLSREASIGFVGSREATDYTERMTSYLAHEAVRYGFLVVSGFAHGVDSIAHAAALEAGGETIAVLGCGVDYDYPKGNESLRAKMLSSGRGLLISEYMPGTVPRPNNFPRRNRILSGISYGVAVTQAGLKSGSLNTARLAQEQRKPLYCVPPPDPDDEKFAGSAKLLEQGAIELNGAEAFVADYRAGTVMTPNPPPKRQETEEPRQMGMLEQSPDDSQLPEKEREILRFLREKGGAHIDDIVSALGIPASELSGKLTGMELDGFVKEDFGKFFRAV